MDEGTKGRKQPTGEGNNPPSLKIVCGRLHLAYADLHRDGTGETDRNLLFVEHDVA